MSTTPRLALPYIVATQAQKDVTHNDALNHLDALTQLSVINRTLNAPPASPGEGDAYIVGTAPTGAWSGQAGAIAVWFSGWTFKTPGTGWRVWVRNENRLYYHTGTGWALLAAPCIDATFSWTPGTLANGSGATSSAVTASGAAPGDFVLIAAPYDTQGATVTGWVSAADTVKARVQNGTGASLTLGSGAWRARVVKV